ncbi:MAG: 2-hydroxyacid dehydrogenase [Allorhizobium sp.]
MLYFHSADEVRQRIFRSAFEQGLPDLRFVTSQDDFDPADVDYLFTWQPPELSPFTGLKVVFSVSAGVDQFSGLADDVPLVRMVDPGNVQKVSQYVLMACLALLRELPTYLAQQRAKEWSARLPALLGNATIGILGLGETGAAAGRMLAGLGADVIGWSRSPKSIEGIHCVSGEQGLQALQQKADIVVCLLPLTTETTGILNAAFFARMRDGAGLVQVGRGPHCVLEDLALALQSGKIGGAFLDVFPEEPLPADHPAWTLPRTIITPHIAGRIDNAQAAENIIRNIRRHRNAESLLWLVDRKRGY